MPVIIIDTEQAALIEVAIKMLEGALTARVERADPEAIISNSLKLQASKLGTVRLLLAQGDPPEFSDLPPFVREQAETLLFHLHTAKGAPDMNRWWKMLRDLANAPAFPPAT